MYRENYTNHLTIKLFPSGPQPLNTSQHSEANNQVSNDSMNHSNPAHHNKKPFLSKIKERAINPEYFRTGITYHALNGFRAESPHEKIKSTSSTPQRSIKPHNRIQDQPSDFQKTINLSQTVVLNNNKKEGYQNIVSRIQHVIQDQNKFLQQEVNYLKDKLQKTQQKLTKQIDKLQKKDIQLQQKNQMIEQKIKEISKLRDSEEQLKDYIKSLSIVLQQKELKIQEALQNRYPGSESALKFKDNQINILTTRLEILQQDNQDLTNEIKKLASNITTDKGCSVSQQKMQAIGQDFQKTINAAVQQNSKLKNIIAQYEGRMEELNTQNHSYKSIIEAFEDRDSYEKDLKSVSERQYLRGVIEEQKEEHDKAVSEYELQIFKLENEIETRRWAQKDSLLESNDQIRLLEKFTELVNEVERTRKYQKSEL